MVFSLNKSILKRIILISLSVLCIYSTVYYCNQQIVAETDGKIFSDINTIPYNKTGLLLGTSKYLSNGKINLYYTYRIEAARELIASGKIKYLIISGDNSRKEYDEPGMMRSDLINAGVDSAVIYLDYAGFRTFDSMIRAREIFGQSSVTVISQHFHNQRAVFIGTKEQMSVIGFDAKDVSKRYGFRVQIREKLARVKVFIDYFFSKKPKFLGPKVEIPLV